MEERGGWGTKRQSGARIKFHYHFVGFANVKHQGHIPTILGPTFLCAGAGARRSRQGVMTMGYVATTHTHTHTQVSRPWFRFDPETRAALDQFPLVIPNRTCGHQICLWFCMSCMRVCCERERERERERVCVRVCKRENC